MTDLIDRAAAISAIHNRNSRKLTAITAMDPEGISFLSAMGAVNGMETAIEIIKELPAHNPWKPIETNPRDGKPFIARGEVYHGAAFECQWKINVWSAEPWFNCIKNNTLPEHCVTHWIPLPSADDA
jgi:hypothetical protein